MGLDWQPLDKPRPGCEAAFDALYEALVGSSDPDPAIWDRFAKVGISAYETLSAPRVGTDAEADRWAAEQYPSRGSKSRSLSLDQWMKTLDGYYVLDLLPRNDGLPVYSNGGDGSYLDLFSFRGGFLEDCRDVLGKRLLSEAWGHHKASELMDYGARLRDCAASFAKKTGTTEVLGQEERPDWLTDWEHPASKVHIIDSAARWCLFWGERGHGMFADF